MIALMLFLLPTCSSSIAADLSIYDDSLASGWADWSWDATTNFSETSQIHSGTHSLSVTFTAAWAGLYLHANPAVDLSSYDKLSFWINGGSAGNQHLRIVANKDGSNVYNVIAQAGTWMQVTISLSDLGGPTSLTDLYWQDTTGGSQPIFYLDDIKLLAMTGPPPPPPPPGTGPDLSIDASSQRHPISAYIYGMNFADENLAKELTLPVRRWGGNSTSRYNWQNNFTNTGSDWYYENVVNGNADDFVYQDRSTGTKTILTMPLIGWISKNSPTSHPYACGFKISKYGPQQDADWNWDPDCGNGNHTDGTPITGNDPLDTSIAITSSYEIDWINHLTSTFGTGDNGGVMFYNLDNEPMLWDSTHRDIHPVATTYDEMRDRTWDYAAAIKSADPSAKTLGPVLWGWCAYFYSAKDGCKAGTDYQTHGSTAFVPWYLQQMKAYELQHGTRILDYLDLHYYPQADGVALSPAGSSSTQALRLRSTRSLWDPNYQDESWIPDKVRLIPRMLDWVNANYPGTKTAVTEYNWGALDHINGALAQADVLGIFGREGLDLATLWGPPTSAQPGAFAFRIYRNYDGAGGRFGDTGVKATSGDQGMLSVYAAQRISDNHITVVVINKTSGGLTSNVSLAGFIAPQSAAVYQYSSNNLNAIVQLTGQPITGNTFSRTFPSNSITLFDISPGTACAGDPVKIAGTTTHYAAIQNAFDSALSEDDVIQVQAVDRAETLKYDQIYDIKLQGGYDCDFATDNAFTTVHGSLTISDGAINVENLLIQ